MSAKPKKAINLRKMYRQLPRYQQYLTIVLAIYLSFITLLGLVVPYIALQQIPAQLSTLVKRPVSLGDVSINPFNLHVSLSDLHLFEENKTDFTGFAELSFELSFWHSLINGAISIKDVSLIRPYLLAERLNQNVGAEFNFSDIINELTKKEADANTVKAPPTELPHIMVNKLAIVSANVKYTDMLTDSQLNYPDINLSIEGFDTLKELDSQQDASNRFSIRLRGKNGGEIATQGQLQLAPLNVIGAVQLNAIALPDFWSFISDEFQAHLDSGKFDFSTDFALSSNPASADNPIELTTSNGQFALRDIVFTHDKRSLLSLPLFAAENIALDLSHKQVKISRLYSEKFTLASRISADGLDLVPLFMPNFISTQATKQTRATQSTAPKETNSEITPASEESVLTETDKPKVNAEPTWSVIVDKVELKDFDIKVNESLVSNNTVWQIAPLNLVTGKIYSDLRDPVQYRLDFSINDQGKFESNGAVDLKQQHIESAVQLTDFSLPQLQTYLAPYLNITLEQGELSIEGQVKASSADDITFIGDSTIKALSIKDNVQNKTLLKWQSMAISKINLDQQQHLLSIDSVDFVKPYSRLIIAKDRTTNIGGLLIEQPKLNQNVDQSTKLDKSAEKKLKLVIGKLGFSQGSTFFADNSLTPNFAASIEQLEGEISQLSSTSTKPAKVDIKGKIDKYAPVTLKGEINPLLAMPYLDLALKFANVELTSVNPYSGTYAGYYIDKGQLSIDLDYQLKDNQLLGSNHMVVDQLTLGEPSDSGLATGLPVTLAIALLQDRHGVIDLGLEVSGDLNSPEFSFGSIILNAFTNLITKAVTAPFSLLSGLFGDHESLDSIEFEPGLAVISDKEATKLSTLTSALIERPKLTLSIEGAVDPMNDSRELESFMLKQKLAEISHIEVSAMPTPLTASNFPTEGPLSQALIALFENEVGGFANDIKTQIIAKNEHDETLSSEQVINTQWHIALYNQVLNQQQVNEQMLGNLASERALAVKAHLVDINKLAPSRIFLLDSRIDINQDAEEAILTLGAE